MAGGEAEPQAQAVEHETSESICAWATETFGTGGTDLHAGVRLMEEVAELVAKVIEFDQYDIAEELMDSPVQREVIDRIHPKMREEAADVAIVLSRLVQRLTGESISFLRKGTGLWYSWRPPASQAVWLNTSAAKLLKALRERESVEIDHPDWVVRKAAVYEALNNVRSNFSLLTRDLRLQQAIDEKMRINRAREWTIIGGHGQHIEDAASDGLVTVVVSVQPHPKYRPIPDGHRVDVAALKAFRESDAGTQNLTVDSAAVYHAGGDLEQAAELLRLWGWGARA